MRKAFTKAMVQTIEEKFGIQLTAEQIEAGHIALEYTKPITKSVIEVDIIRTVNNAKCVVVTANFKNDSYKWLHGIYKITDLKKALAHI